ncbi:MAG: MurR/RpiR family transcriptional regulator [Lachnospiraceae bacterium]|nr:MurR/RpiR family transcriptional regulator [Lachnospiraceae bacterium]
MITEQMKEAIPKLRKSEQKAANYLLAHKEQIENMSLDKFAKKAGVSQPTIVRMLRAAGYEGYKEAKRALIEERSQQKESQTYEIMEIQLEDGTSVEDIPGKVIHNTIGLLEDSLRAISAKELQKAIEKIAHAKRVVLFAVEDSDTIAVDLMTKLLYIGIDCTFNQDYYLQSIQAGHMQKGDVAIGISYTGTSQNTVDVLKQAKKSGADTIAITNFPDTPLVKYADVVIMTSNKQLLYGEDIFSRTIHLAVVDMIYMGLLLSDPQRYKRELERSSKLIKSRKYE